MIRRCLLLVVFGLVPALAPTPSSAGAGAEPVQPALIAQALQTALFTAETALLAGDLAAADAAVVDAETAARMLLTLLTADATVAPEIEASLTVASDAVDQADASLLSFTHGRLWAAVVRGAYAETLAAVAAEDAEQAGSWLLLRDFRPTTRFDRPHADATLAIRRFAGGEITADETAEAVRADLLDTYQSRLESALHGLSGTAPGALSLSQAHSAGLATGYWRTLAPAYEEQFGAAARTEADAAFAFLGEVIAGKEAAGFERAVADATTVTQSFRAAPLSEQDQARRSGQLLRYLSLVAVEYGRGVKQGQVLLPFEITEAQAFLAGADAAFADLRLPLRELDAAETAAVEPILADLDRQLSAAAAQSEIADPTLIQRQTEEAAQRLQAIFPAAWLEAGGDADFDVVESLLDQMVAAVAAGEYQQAESARLEAYAVFETGPEKRLLAFAPAAVERVEQLFWDGTGGTPGLRTLLADRAGVPAVQATLRELETELTEAQAALSGGTAPAAIIFNAATIVFREGLEAVLILASLLASMVGANRRYKAPLAIGAGAALVVTGLLFILARGALLSFSQYGEQLEAIVSLVAIGVLLLVMNWFFHKVYWTRWIAGHHQRRRRLLIGGAAGQALGLVLLGFSSVFREGAETVLFLQALVLEAGTWIVVQGTLMGLAATAVVGILTLVMQTKLPHKKMLIVTGLLIAAVLVTMVGGTVHTLQLVGWLPITAIQGLAQLPYWLGVWFGIYPTWEGLLAQVAALIFVVGSYYVAEYTQRRHRGAVQAHHEPATAG